ncbi:MAG: SHOCT domain-containing protein [Deltaproteobacteria bacterium]|nr:SHOCT domain-containing protein [Deltaproteobacteria bacterium]
MADLTDELAALASLKESGALTEEEFAAAKAKLLGGGADPAPAEQLTDKEIKRRAKLAEKAAAKERRTEQSKRTLGGCLVIIVLFVIIGFMMKDNRTPEEKAAEAKASKAREAAQEAECFKDLQCAGRKMAAESWVCITPTEKMARNSHKWTDGTLEPKFSHFRWKIKGKVLTLIGDKIQYQNAFGAWINHVYECDIDLKTKSLLDVRAQPGRL